MTDRPHRIPADDVPADGAGAPGPGLPEVADREAWEAARAELLLEEKAHTRAGDALAAKRRRMPMLEVDGDTTVVGADGPVPFRSLFEGRDELLVYQHMWWDGAPHQGQCEGCTMTAWHLHDASYLRAAGVSFAILTTGAWEEVAPFVAFMGYTEPWFSVRETAPPIGGDMGYLQCYVREGDRVFLTYAITGRGTEISDPTLALLDLTAFGRREAWQDMPEGRVAERDACWFWRTDVDGNPTWGPTGRPAAQWTRPGATAQTSLGRTGMHH